MNAQSWTSAHRSPQKVAGVLNENLKFKVRNKFYTVCKKISVATDTRTIKSQKIWVKRVIT